MNTITFETRISLQDFLRYQFTFYFTNFWILLTTFTGYAALICALLQYQGIQLGAERHVGLLLLYGLVVGVMGPANFLFKAWQFYRQHPRLKERIRYHFESEGYRLQGEDFEEQFVWTQLHRIELLPSWALLWHNKRSAHLIPLQQLSAQDKQALLQLLQTQQQESRKVKLGKG